MHRIRTTLRLEEDALDAARAYAKACSLPLGQSVSALIRRASVPQLPLKQHDGIWVLDLPVHTPRVTAAKVKRLLASA